MELDWVNREDQLSPHRGQIYKHTHYAGLFLRLLETELGPSSFLGNKCLLSDLSSTPSSNILVTHFCLLFSPKERISDEVGMVQGYIVVWGGGEGWQPTLSLREKYQVCRVILHNPTGLRKPSTATSQRTEL